MNNIIWENGVLSRNRCIHTFSVFTFLGGALLGVLLSSPFDFLFPLDDLEADGFALAADPEAPGLTGLLSTGSCLGASFCFGASG